MLQMICHGVCSFIVGQQQLLDNLTQEQYCEFQYSQTLKEPQKKLHTTSRTRFDFLQNLLLNGLQNNQKEQNLGNTLVLLSDFGFRDLISCKSACHCKSLVSMWEFLAKCQKLWLNPSFIQFYFPCHLQVHARWKLAI